MKPRVSVGIPFFDEEATLEGAIRSVLAQRGVEVELILVDDGSTDRSLSIARTFESANVSVLSDGRRRGLPARLNEIARRARFDLLARMDADDVSHPDRLAREVALLERGADVVGTWIALVDERDELFAVSEHAALPATPASALRHGILAHATMLAKKRVILDHPYDEALTRAEDRDLWCRLVGTVRIDVVREPLYVVRVHATRAGFVDDYAESHRQNRTIVLRHGPAAVGRLQTARWWLAAHAKPVIMRSAVKLGFAHALVRKRGRAPTDGERALVAEALLSARTG